MRGPELRLVDGIECFLRMDGWSPSPLSLTATFAEILETIPFSPSLL